MKRYRIVHVTKYSFKNPVTSCRGEGHLTAKAYLADSSFVTTNSALRNYARISFGRKRTVVETAYDFMQRINRDFSFDAQSATVFTAAGK